MKLRLKEIRQIKGLKASEVAEKLSITKNSLSEWESGKRIPPCERIIQLADFYNVSVDYLLGRDEGFDTNNDSVRPISKSTLSIFDGRPVWIDGHGWALVSSTDQTLLFSDGRKIGFNAVEQVSFSSPPFSEPVLPDTMPLDKEDICKCESVWVEPIGTHKSAREALRGWYDVKNEYVENTRGSRFFLDSYDATWLAFANKA